MQYQVALTTPTGEWTERRNRILGNTNLERIGRESGLEALMNVNPRNPVQPSQKLTATLVEAVLGAVNLDGGMDAMETVMVNIGLIEDPTQVTYSMFCSTWDGGLHRLIALTTWPISSAGGCGCIGVICEGKGELLFGHCNLGARWQSGLTARQGGLNGHSFFSLT